MVLTFNTPNGAQIVITELEFKSLMQQGYNRIPLMLEAFADLETPLSLYLKLAHHKDGGKYSFLLESVVGGERFGRYSFIGLPARTLLQARGFGDEARTEVVTDGVVVESAAGNPLDFIEQYQKRFKVALRPGLPRFCGGLAGYFGYDAVRYIEKKLEKTCPPDSLGTPDILLLQCEELAVIDNLSGKLYLIVYADTGMPEALYRALRSLNPSPYMYFYNFGDFHVVGASPEILVRQEKTEEGVKVTIRPLAGTRPRGATPEKDKAAELELVNDPKERAEHVMLIDLARNDIGRIAKIGSVKVTEAFVVERYSHVMHIVSNVEGILNEGMTNMDVLKATFPAGTLTGAPKVHAMELIDRLEPIKRGLYGGACGYLSYAGDMDVAIAIRTAIIKDQTLYVQAAAGVVADSVPEMEWRETEHKARALLRASELVEEGLE